MNDVLSASFTATVATTDALPSLAKATADAQESSENTPAITTRETSSWIYARPSMLSPKIGYFRVGARLRSNAEPYAGKDALACGGSWFTVEPDGFVCVGRNGITRDFDDPRVVTAMKFPPKAGALPFAYASSRGSYLYTTIPGGSAEPANIALLPPLEKGTTRAAWAGPETFLALLTKVERQGDSFYLTTEHLLVPADRVVPATPTKFHGIELADPFSKGPSSKAERLPIAWTRKPGASPILFRLNGDTLTETPFSLPYPEHASATGHRREQAGVPYLELERAPVRSDRTDAGRYFVREGDTVLVEPQPAHPPSVLDDEIWIDVNTSLQTLVAYKGARPIYATLVSTGEGMGDRITPLGQFRVYQKHASSTLRAAPRPQTRDPGYRFDDVPHVQYIVGNIALHAAYWHESFGVARSHGCINLAPIDADVIFGMTLPKLPAAWHGIYVVRPSGNAASTGAKTGGATLVAIHR